MNPLNYECLRCGHRFPVQVTDVELVTRLDATRAEGCPECRQRVGTGPVKCRSCRHNFDVEFPHWHVQCTVSKGQCPQCAAEWRALCHC